MEGVFHYIKNSEKGGFWHYGEAGVVNGLDKDKYAEGYALGQDLEAGPGALYYAYCVKLPLSKSTFQNKDATEVYREE